MTPASSAAEMTARTPSARCSGSEASVAGANITDDGTFGAPSGSGQTGPIGELRDVPGDRTGTLDEPPQPFVVDAAGGGDADPLADDEPQVAVGVGLGHVLVDLAVREPGEARVGGRDERLGLGGAGGRGQGDGPLGDREPLGGGVAHLTSLT